MAAAREEFLERGYEKASMRSIADRCGMTAAGIYRHCKDKEDLFCQLVSPAEDKLMDWGRAHMHRYEEPVKKNRKMVWQDSFIDMMREVVYPNMEDYHLLIARSKGSKYENYLHDMTEMAQDKFNVLSDSVEASITEIDTIRQMTAMLDQIKVELSNTTTELGAISEELGASAEEVAASCQTVTNACSDTQNSTAEMRNINEDMSAAIDFFKLSE